MKFYPYQKLVIESPLKVSDSFARLVSATTAKNWWKSLGSWHLSLSGSEFYMRRAGTTRHGISANGRISEIPFGSRIEVTILPHWTVTLFLLFWCGAFSLGIVELTKEMIAKAAFDNKILFLLTMLFSGYAFMLYGWNREARNLRKFLEDTLNVRYK